MIIKNAKVFLPDCSFKECDVVFSKIIEAVGTSEQEDGLDAHGCYLVPGFIDIHTHGAMGSDTCDASVSALSAMSGFYASKGVTSFCATTMTYDEGTLTNIMQTVRNFCANSNEKSTGARCVGINMEGPFINKIKKGAQSDKNIIDPDIGMFNRLFYLSGELIKLVDIAPECDKDYAFIKAASRICKVSFAHTNANYDTAKRGFESGASHVTHLFNAMTPFHQFDPGVIGAASDCGAYVEVICDGIHLHPSVVRNIFRMFESDKICLISDSMRCSGMKDGEYELGGQPVIVKNGKATLLDGTIAGSSINLNVAVKNIVAFGIPLEKAIASATINPARSIGLETEIGAIEKGKKADLVLLDKELNVIDVFINGQRVINKNNV
jgi:N-acetylglucosamine-6-phosphate deacetylase